MTDTPRISIVTPTWNRKNALLRAIESVRGQTFADYEHIVIDDGSTDGTDEAMAAESDRRLRFVRLTQWRGANAARNIGLGMARARLVTFLDSDDVFLPFRLERTVALFEGSPTIKLVISSFAASKGGPVSDNANRGAYFDSEMLERAVAAQVTAIAGSAITVRKSAIEAAGLFDEGLLRLQDRDLLLRLARHGYGAALLETVDWIKYHSPDSISRQRGGYVAAYADLLGRHPRIRARYPEIAVYMIARRILNNLLQGHVSAAIADYRVNRASPALGYSVAALCKGYVAGRRQRRRILSEVRALQDIASTASETGIAALAGQHIKVGNSIP